jgi:hypothetical protein
VASRTHSLRSLRDNLFQPKVIITLICIVDSILILLGVFLIGVVFMLHAPE